MTIHVSKVDRNIILRTSVGKTLDVINLHFDAAYLIEQKLVTHTAQGRGTVYFFTLGDTQLVLRHYKRGGLVAKLNDDKFIYTGIENTRSYLELEVLQGLREAKVNVPLPIAGRIVRTGALYTADIITEVISDALELHELLQKEPVSSDIWQAVGSEIRKMHNAQLCHYDLNVKNILLANFEDACKVHLLDFDKCEVKSGSTWKQANLERLQRSLVKQFKAQANYHYQLNDWKSLIAGYERNN